MSRMEILFLDILTSDPEVRKEDNEVVLVDYGGYGGLVERCFPECNVTTFDAGQSPRELFLALDLDKYDGIFAGGSVANVGPDDILESWQEFSMALMRDAISKRIPFL